MKKIIVIIACLLLTMPIFSVSKGELLGKWKSDNVTITFTLDSIFWDEYTDNNLTELIEGDVYTYKVIKDTIFYESFFDKEEMGVKVVGNDLILIFPHTNEKEIYHKIDINQEKPKMAKKYGKKFAHVRKK